MTQLDYFSLADARTLTRAAHVNVLIACEESQAETLAFRQLGFNAFSCDVQPCRRGANPAWHIQGDVTPYLDGCTDFVTLDGCQHNVGHWHLIIAHPPCTYLCRVSSIHLMRHGILDPVRERRMLQARRFFFRCLDARADFVAVENPIPMRRARLPRPSCYACPSWYGVKYTKKTLYWTKNLPPLFAGLEHPRPSSFVYSSRGKYRSRTFPQLAQAIAEQWGAFVLTELEERRTSPA